jgi:hypothetical protein
LSAEITRVVEQDPACERLMTVPGIGPDHLERDGGCDRRRRCHTWVLAIPITPSDRSTGREHRVNFARHRIEPTRARKTSPCPICAAR